MCKRLLDEYDMLLYGASLRYDAQHRHEHAEAQGWNSRQCYLLSFAIGTVACGAKRAQVPRTGEDLADLVRVLLKTSTSDSEGAKALLKSCIHQARVRRAVVVKFILDAKARCHPAYMHVDEDIVRKRSLSLPRTSFQRSYLVACYPVMRALTS